MSALILVAAVMAWAAAVVARKSAPEPEAVRANDGNGDDGNGSRGNDGDNGNEGS